jgi:hypothetical protein
MFLSKVLPVSACVSVAALALTGCGDDIVLSSKLVAFQSTTPLSLKTQSGSYVLLSERDGEGASSVTFTDEGHGWAILNLTLENGQVSTFHLGLKTKDAEKVLNNGEFFVQSQLTKQKTALLFTPSNKTSKRQNSQRRETCYETQYRTYCRYDPINNRQWCTQEPVQVEGMQDVFVTIDTDVYSYSLQFISDDRATSYANSQLETAVVRTTKQFGICETNVHPFPAGPF